MEWREKDKGWEANDEVLREEMEHQVESEEKGEGRGASLLVVTN